MVRTVKDFQTELPSVVEPKVFKTIGRCIYCGRDGRVERLTREHVIPKGLNGSVIFSGASCESCRVLTARFEEEVLRSEYKIYRAVANWPMTRREPARPFGLLLPNLPPVGSSQSIAEISIGCFWFPLDSDQRFPQQSQSFPLVPFLRLLAKIAHGMVMGETKGKGFVPCLTDMILRSEANPYRFIGSAPTDMLAVVPHASNQEITVGAKLPSRTIHQIRIAAISPDGEKLLVSVFIRLFAQHPTPLYQVVAGEILPNSPLCARVAPILANANP
jgi:hypothetical protein